MFEENQVTDFAPSKFWGNITLLLLFVYYIVQLYIYQTIAFFVAEFLFQSAFVARVFVYTQNRADEGANVSKVDKKVSISQLWRHKASKIRLLEKG